MGLDFEPLEAHWSYSGFDRFRTRLANAIGLDWDNWNALMALEHPIKPLLHHSDCDGELSSEDCGKVYPKLLELINPWPDDDDDKINAKLLAESMKLCHEEKKPLLFC